MLQSAHQVLPWQRPLDLYLYTQIRNNPRFVLQTCIAFANLQYMKVPCTFRIDSDVLQAIVAEAAILSKSEGRKVSQAEVVERAIGTLVAAQIERGRADLDRVGLAILQASGPPGILPRKQSKKDWMLAELKALDPTGAARADVELGNFELPRGGSVSQPRTSLDAVGPKASDGRGKVSMETWRANRKPLLKQKDRK